MNYTDKQLTTAVRFKGLRPGFAGTESGAPPRLLSLVQSCWDVDMDNRPSFDDIISKLDLSMGWKELERALLYMRKLLETTAYERSSLHPLVGFMKTLPIEHYGSFP
ncbi:unnamed protein product [Lactuca saligna]|uniref:Serine-threonine/tyrosine-protein kinase catalytic domain-containing protein n=1 Tax=Lactuca saligna TaxID=75948 RepID=A0AA35ZC16_LACSI|nr:unnamed protein product [Lactuca saligna]